MHDHYNMITTGYIFTAAAKTHSRLTFTLAAHFALVAHFGMRLPFSPSYVLSPHA